MWKGLFISIASIPDIQLGNKFFGHLIVDCNFSIRLNQETVNMIKMYLLCASSLSSHLECAACW